MEIGKCLERESQSLKIDISSAGLVALWPSVTVVHSFGSERHSSRQNLQTQDRVKGGRVCKGAFCLSWLEGKQYSKISARISTGSPRCRRPFSGEVVCWSMYREEGFALGVCVVGIIFGEVGVYQHSLDEEIAWAKQRVIHRKLAKILAFFYFCFFSHACDLSENNTRN